MFDRKIFLFLTVLAAAVTLSGCTAPSESGAVSLPQGELGTPSLSQPAEPDVSASEPELPTAASASAPSEPEVPVPEVKPEAPEVKSEPCKHGQTRTVVKQDASCTAQGHSNAVCTACGEVVASGTIPSSGHDYRSTVVDAVCETDGSRTNICSRCGDVQTEVIAAPGHDWSDASCGTAATCTICNAVSPTVTDHSWVVKYAMGKPECEHCGTKYPFDKLVVKSNMLDVPILAGTKSITIIDMNYEVRAFEGPFNAQSTCRLDITVDGQASNACTLTRGSHLIAEDGTKITSIYDQHGSTTPVCDGSFTEMFSFNIPSCEGTYTVVFSAQ